MDVEFYDTLRISMGKKLTVYLIDGTEYGARIAEIGNWVGKGIYSPRVAIPKILTRMEVNNPGVYFLKSRPSSDVFLERIYIGEAENIGTRLRQHLADPNKDFEELVFFISKDELLTKTQIKFLESKLVQLAHEAKSAEIDNGNSPSLPTLHEADISDMDYFLEQIKLILPLMGFRFLISTVAEPPKNDLSSLDSPTKTPYRIKTSTFKAEMYESEQGYVVTKGSQANKTITSSMSETYVRLRHKLIESGVLTENGEFLEFAKDTVFSSPSAASNIVLGRQSAGPIEWIDASGKTYKENTEN